MSTTLTPGPTFETTFDPLHQKTPPRDLAEARRTAHFLARPFFAWGQSIFIAVSPSQHISTGLTRADVPGVWKLPEASDPPDGLQPLGPEGSTATPPG